MYLAHKKTPTPWDHHRALRIGLLMGPRRRQFRMFEVPLSLGVTVRKKRQAAMLQRNILRLAEVPRSK